MYEITTGSRPYEEINDSDDEEIENRYSAGQFPRLDGLPYQEIIHKCWTCQYTNIDQLRLEVQNRVLCKTSDVTDVNGG